MLYRLSRKIVKNLTPPGTVYRSIVFFTFDMADIETTFMAVNPTIECHIIDSPQSSLLQRLCQAYPEKKFSRRMTHGDHQAYCIVICGKIAGFAWATTSPCVVSEIGFTLTPGPRHFYIYDCYVSTEFRGQGLYTALLRQILIDYKTRHSTDIGFRTACIAAEPGNKASIRGIKSVGFEEFTRARFLRFGQHSRLFGTEKLTDLFSRQVISQARR